MDGRCTRNRPRGTIGIISHDPVRTCHAMSAKSLVVCLDFLSHLLTQYIYFLLYPMDTYIDAVVPVACVDGYQRPAHACRVRAFQTNPKGFEVSIFFHSSLSVGV